MSDDIKGVFVRLPLSDEQKEAFYARHYTGDPASGILAIGTPVTGGDIPVAAYTSQHDIDRVRKGKSGDIYGAKNWEGSDEEVFSIPLIRQSDAQAAIVERYHVGWVAGKLDAHLSYTRKIAALEAEVVRLREAIYKMIDMSRNAQTWSLNNRSASCRDELSAIGRLGEKTLKGGAA